MHVPVVCNFQAWMDVLFIIWKNWCTSCTNLPNIKAQRTTSFIPHQQRNGSQCLQTCQEEPKLHSSGWEEKNESGIKLHRRIDLGSQDGSIFNLSILSERSNMVFCSNAGPGVSQDTSGHVQWVPYGSGWYLFARQNENRIWGNLPWREHISSIRPPAWWSTKHCPEKDLRWLVPFIFTTIFAPYSGRQKSTCFVFFIAFPSTSQPHIGNQLLQNDPCCQRAKASYSAQTEVLASPNFQERLREVRTTGAGTSGILQGATWALLEELPYSCAMNIERQTTIRVKLSVN